MATSETTLSLRLHTLSSHTHDVVHLRVCRLFISFQSAPPASHNTEYIREFMDRMHIHPLRQLLHLSCFGCCDGIQFEAKILFRFWLTLLLLYHSTLCVPLQRHHPLLSTRCDTFCVAVDELVCNESQKFWRRPFPVATISQDFMQKIHEKPTRHNVVWCECACACFKTRLTTRLAWIQLDV